MLNKKGLLLGPFYFYHYLYFSTCSHSNRAPPYTSLQVSFFTRTFEEQADSESNIATSKMNFIFFSPEHKRDIINPFFCQKESEILFFYWSKRSCCICSIKNVGTLENPFLLKISEAMRANSIVKTSSG